MILMKLEVLHRVLQVQCAIRQSTAVEGATDAARGTDATDNYSTPNVIVTWS